MSRSIYTKSTRADELHNMREAAADWILTIEEATPERREQVLAQCRDWLAADPRRQQVLKQMQQLWSAVNPQQKRHPWATTLGVLVLASLLLSLPWQVWTADYRTAAGEIRDVTLPDGSVVVLNSNGAIDIDYDNNHRTVHLLKGELMVTVQPDAAGRVFAVTTAHGSATALGTRYSVSLEQDYTHVNVHESKVRALPRNAATEALTLTAGHSAHLTATAVSAPEITDDRNPDWAERRLVFNDVPLAEVVQRLGAYRPGWLLLSDELAERNLRFTGVLPADNSETALSLLTTSLTLDVQHASPYFTRLRSHN